MNNIIVVTTGDPMGIGLEVIIKPLSEAGLAGVPVAVVGCVCTLRRITVMDIMPQAGLRVIQKVYDVYFAPDVINVINESLINPDTLTPGVIQAAAGDLAYRYVKRAAALALSGEVKAIATAPLSKEVLHLGGHNHPGHTELLARLTGGKEHAMILYTDELRVIHILTHISLRKFLDILSGEEVKTVIRVANYFLRRVGIERPHIAVADVDPRAGEYGLFGIEEIRIIAPAIETIQTGGIGATGSCPPDIMFM